MSELKFKKIVVPHDFSATAERALDFAREFAQTAGPAEVILVHAYSLPVEIEALAVHGAEKVLKDLAHEADTKLAALVADLKSEGVSAEATGTHGRPEDVIIQLASKRGADLIVIGTHGHTGIPHLLLGSVAERVVRGAPCPVITIK